VQKKKNHARRKGIKPKTFGEKNSHLNGFSEMYPAITTGQYGNERWHFSCKKWSWYFDL